MKRLIFSLVVAAAIAISAVIVTSCGKIQAQAVNDLKIANLRGSVQSVREITYRAENKFGEFIKGERQGGRDGKFDDKPWSELPLSYPLNSAAIYPFENSLLNFDKNGRITDILIYDEYNQIKSKYIYKYDAKGRKLERAEYDETGKLQNKFVFDYEPNGQLSSMICGYPDIYCKAKPTQFDNNGNMTVIQLNYEDDSEKLNCRFDKNNNLIAIGFNDSEEYSGAEFDNNNRILKDIFGATYIYDDKGYLLKKMIDGQHTIYSNHDSYGNWTKAIVGEWQIIERTITYW